MPRGSTSVATREGGAFTRSLRDRPPGPVAVYQRRRILIAATAIFRAAHAWALGTLRRRLRGAGSTGDRESVPPDITLAALLAGDISTLPSFAPSLTRFVLAYRPALEASPPVPAVRTPITATGG